MPAARHAMSKQNYSEKSPANVEHHLDYVCPDDCRHTPFKRVKQGQRANDSYRKSVACTNGDADDDRDSEDTNALCHGTQNQEEHRGHLMKPCAESLAYDLVGGQ